MNLLTVVLSLRGSAIPVVHPGAADGVFSLLWLIIALPLAGAVLLLVGGALAPRALERVGHWLGTATVAGSFALSLAMFVSLLDRGRRSARSASTCTPGSRSAASTSAWTCSTTRCRRCSCC